MFEAFFSSLLAKEMKKTHIHWAFLELSVFSLSPTLCLAVASFPPHPYSWPFPFSPWLTRFLTATHLYLSCLRGEWGWLAGNWLQGRKGALVLGVVHCSCQTNFLSDFSNVSNLWEVRPWDEDIMSSPVALTPCVRVHRTKLNWKWERSTCPPVWHSMSVCVLRDWWWRRLKWDSSVEFSKWYGYFLLLWR